jgi:hypothetical protein
MKLNLDWRATNRIRVSYANSDKDLHQFMESYMEKIHKAIPSITRISFASRSPKEYRQQVAKKR